jgi:hypothetical protein
MTAAQQHYLESVLNTLPTPKKQTLKAALNTAVFWVFSSLALCVLWFISSLMIAAVSDVDIGVSSSYSRFIFPFITLIAGLFAINSTRKWLNASGNLYSLVNSDLRLNKVNQESYLVVGVKCFKEPEHNGLIYFLNLAPASAIQAKNLRSGIDSKIANKIRVIYDYESQSSSIETRLLVVTSALTIITGCHSNIVLENKFSGEALTQIEQFDLTLPPEKWPSPDSWLDNDWQDLASIYAASN